MNVKIVTNNGNSFAGCAAYCLHDEGANTSERVEWTETVNLGTKDPDAAWRVMAATAANANQLKREAGVPPTGNKSKGPVTHIVFSWAEDEIKDLTAEKQQQAVKEALSKLGKDTTNSKKVKNGYRHYGDECQALIVGHRDKAHPHVHVILNRVHPEHGRMLPTGNDQLKMSKWAEKYQKQHGNEHLTPQRTLNNEARARGEWVKYEGNLSRRDYERAKKVADAAEQKKKDLVKKQGQRAWEINKQTRAQKQRHKEQWLKSEAERKARMQKIGAVGKERLAAIEKGRRQETAKRKRAVRDSFKERWEQLQHERRAELSDFDKREQTHFGRITNALKSLDWKKLQKVHSAFSLIASAGGNFKSEEVRRKGFEAELDRKKQLLLKEQQAAEAAEARQEKSKAAMAKMQQERQQTAALREAREQYATERADLLRNNALEQAKIKSQWREHDKLRSQEWKKLIAQHPAVEPPMGAVDKYAAEAVGRLQGRTKPADLISNKGHGTKDAARIIDQYAEEAAKRLKQQPKQEREKEDDKGKDEGQQL